MQSLNHLIWGNFGLNFSELIQHQIQFTLSSSTLKFFDQIEQVPAIYLKLNPGSHFYNQQLLIKHQEKQPTSTQLPDTQRDLKNFKHSTHLLSTLQLAYFQMSSDSNQEGQIQLKQETGLPLNPEQLGKDGSARTMSSSSHSSRPKENTAVQQESSELSAIPIQMKKEAESRLVEDESDVHDEDGASSCSSYNEADAPEEDFDDSPYPDDGPRSSNQTATTRQGGCGKNLDVLYQVLHVQPANNNDSIEQTEAEHQSSQETVKQDTNLVLDQHRLKTSQFKQNSAQPEKHSVRKRATRNQIQPQARPEEMTQEPSRKRMNTRYDKKLANEKPLKIVRNSQAATSQDTHDVNRHYAAGALSAHQRDQRKPQVAAQNTEDVNMVLPLSRNEQMMGKLRDFTNTIIPMPYQKDQKAAAVTALAAQEAAKLQAQAPKQIVEPLPPTACTDQMSQLSIGEKEVSPMSSKLQQALEIGQEIDFFEHTRIHKPEKVFKYPSVEFDKYGTEMDKTKVPGYYMKFVEPVYKDVQKTVEKCWSYHVTSYEISQQMIDLLEKNKVNISHKDAEILIDTWEKVAIDEKQQSKVYLKEAFERIHKKTNPRLVERVSDDAMNKIFDHCWKNTREQRKNRSYIRMFWVHQDDMDKPYKTFLRPKGDTKHYTRRRGNQDYRIKSYGSKFVERDNAVLFCQELQSAHDILLSQLDQYKLEDAQFDLLMGMPIQDPVMRELMQGKNEPSEQQIADLLKIPNKADVDMNDYMLNHDKPCSLKFNVTHPRQDKNHKRYFHESLAHHANMGNSREFDRPSNIKRVNSIVPSNDRARGAVAFDHSKQDKRHRGADASQVITQPNQADKEMHSNDQQSRTDEDVSMSRADTNQSHLDKNQTKEKKKRKDAVLSKTPSAILNKNNSNQAEQDKVKLEPLKQSNDVSAATEQANATDTKEVDKKGRDGRHKLRKDANQRDKSRSDLPELSKNMSSAQAQKEGNANVAPIEKQQTQAEKEQNKRDAIAQPSDKPINKEIIQQDAPPAQNERTKKKIKKHQRSNLEMIHLFSMIKYKLEREQSVKLSGESDDVQLVDKDDRYRIYELSRNGYRCPEQPQDQRRVKFVKRKRRAIKQEQGIQKMMFSFSSPRRQINVQVPVEREPDMYELQYAQENNMKLHTGRVEAPRNLQNDKAIARQKVREQKAKLKRFQEEYKLLQSKGIQARRGRCNRVLYKSMMKQMFDFESSDEENYEPGVDCLLGNGSKRDIIDLMKNKTDRQNGNYELMSNGFSRNKYQAFQKYSRPIDNIMATQRQLLNNMERIHQRKRENKHRYKMDVVYPFNSLHDDKKVQAEATLIEGPRNQMMNDPILSSMFKKEHSYLYQSLMGHQADEALLNAGGMANNVYEGQGSIQQKLEDYNDILRCQEIVAKSKKLEDSNNTSSFGNTNNMMSFDGNATYPTATPSSPIVEHTPAFRQTDAGPIGLSSSGRQNLLSNLTFMKQSRAGGPNIPTISTNDQSDGSYLPASSTSYGESMVEYMKYYLKDFDSFRKAIVENKNNHLINQQRQALRPQALNIPDSQRRQMTAQ